MEKHKQIKKYVAIGCALALCMGVFSACGSGTNSVSSESLVASLPIESTPPESVAIPNEAEQVAQGIEALQLEVLYETPVSWEDTMETMGTDTQEITFDGQANRAFIRITGGNEAVYNRVLFDATLQRKDGTPSYAVLTALNLGGALPIFTITYPQDTELTDYVVQLVANNAYENKTKVLEVPAMQEPQVITSGMAFPGDMVEIDGVVYYYAGPARTQYEIGAQGLNEGESGFSLSALVSLVPAGEMAQSNATDAMNVFLSQELKMVDGTTKEAAQWPVSAGFEVAEQGIEPLLQPLMAEGNTFATQSAKGSVTWKHVEVSEDTDTELLLQDEMLEQAVDYLMQVAFAYGPSENPIYFMSLESYFTLANQSAK